jgi:HAD superfamily hydrolase (TIGR01549 family)
MIKAVSFDLWDTIIHDDSDEPKRAARNLRSKREERRFLVWRALNSVEPIDYEAVCLAYDVADAAFNRVWHHQHVTWEIAERLQVLLTGLGRRLSGEVLTEVVRAHEEMEIVVPPDPVAGVAEALSDLSRRYRLCVVSDSIVTPGRCLRKLLALHDLGRYFTGFVFSDEVGYSKPHRAMFEAAARQMGVEIPEMAHVGDRDHNDIKGPRALGMKAVLFTGVSDRDRQNTSADAICPRHKDLPAIIDRLAAG